MKEGQRVKLVYQTRLHNGRIEPPGAQATVKQRIDDVIHDEKYVVRFDDGVETILFPREVEEVVS